MNLSRFVARTGRKNIDSNKGECRVMEFVIRAAEGALHEAHVRIEERQQLFLAGFPVRSRHVAADVREPNIASMFVIEDGSASIGSNPSPTPGPMT
jgi:hypothetical protein